VSRRKRLPAGKAKRPSAKVLLPVTAPSVTAPSVDAPLRMQVVEPASVALRAVDIEDERAEAVLLQRADLTPEQKLALSRARRGQGEYRHNVEQIEKCCRVTGLFDRRHLRARHIRPWRDSDDQQKLDGHNGLLLSPHLDHLFERGFISFADNGELLVSRHLNPAVFETWGLRPQWNVGPFTIAQQQYLAHHREKVFEREPQQRGRGDSA
jgi:putative restriction endonuclease